MEQKIIMEELARMKNLMVTKRGTVISEQLDYRLYNKGYFDQDKGYFDQDKSPFGKKLDGTYSKSDLVGETDALLRGWPEKYSCVKNRYNLDPHNNSISSYPSDNRIEIRFSDIKTTYSSDGRKSDANGKESTYNCNTEKSVLETRSSKITKAYCSVKNGKIPSFESSKGPITNMLWSDYVKTYKVTTDEIENAKRICPEKIRTIDSGLSKLNPVVGNRKIKFTPNEKFPLLFGQKGLAIRNLQSLIGLKKPTGNFYTITEKTLSDKMKSLGLTYNRKVGVTQDIYDKLRRPLSPVDTPKISTTTPTGIENIVNPGAAASGIIQK